MANKVLLIVYELAQKGIKDSKCFANQYTSYMDKSDIGYINLELHNNCLRLISKHRFL